MNQLACVAAVVWMVPAMALAQASPPTPAADPEAGDTEAPTTATPAPASEPVAVDASLETELAAPEEDAGDPGEPGPLVLGLELGAIFPQLFTELGTHVSFGLEVGYALPFLERKLEIMGAAAYAPPANDFEVDDFTGEVSVQELHFSLGPRYRLLARKEPWNVSAALGLRLFLVQSTSTGSRAGEAFAELEEQSTEVGFFVALGGEYRLGPGALLLDLDLGYSGLGHDITGDGEPKSGPDAASTGNLAATLGYRFFLL